MNAIQYAPEGGNLFARFGLEALMAMSLPVAIRRPSGEYVTSYPDAVCPEGQLFARFCV